MQDIVTLREITAEQDEITRLLNAAYDDTEAPDDATDEDRAALLEARASVEHALFGYLVDNEAAGTAKVESYCHVIKRIERLQKDREEEAKRIKNLAEIDANKVKGLKSSLALYMGRSGRPKIETGLFKLSLCLNGGKVPLILEPEIAAEPTLLPCAFQRVVVTPDNEALRRALEDGDAEAAKCATLGERGKHVRIS
jgi:hypothetical protein